VHDPERKWRGEEEEEVEEDFVPHFLLHRGSLTNQKTVFATTNQ